MWQSCTCGKNSLDFILIKILHTEYDFQDTDFTMLNLNNVICKLNMKLSSLKCLNKKKKKRNYKMYGRCVTSDHTHSLFYQLGVFLVVTSVLLTVEYSTEPDITCLRSQCKGEP